MKMRQENPFKLFFCILLQITLLAACNLAPSVPEMDQAATATQTPTITPTIVWFPPTPTLAPQPTSAPISDQNLKPGVGALRIKDDFQSTENWNRETTPRGNIVPGNGKLTLVVQSPKGELYSIRKDTSVDNFYAEATFTANLCQGDDMTGMIFRTNGESSYYRYLVDCNGRVTAQVVIGGTPTAMHDWAPSGELIAGLPAPFKLGVWASKDVLRFFINDQFQFEAARGTYVYGGIGFYARAAGDPSLSVSISDFSVYDVSASPLQTLTSPVVAPTITPVH